MLPKPNKYFFYKNNDKRNREHISQYRCNVRQAKGQTGGNRQRKTKTKFNHWYHGYQKRPYELAHRRPGQPLHLKLPSFSTIFSIITYAAAIRNGINCKIALNTIPVCYPIPC